MLNQLMKSKKYYGPCAIKKYVHKINFNNLLSKIFIHIFQIASDIIKYKLDHTGANTQLGGIKTW